MERPFQDTGEFAGVIRSVFEGSVLTQPALGGLKPLNETIGAHAFALSYLRELLKWRGDVPGIRFGLVAVETQTREPLIDRPERRRDSVGLDEPVGGFVQLSVGLAAQLGSIISLDRCGRLRDAPRPYTVQVFAQVGLVPPVQRIKFDQVADTDGPICCLLRTHDVGRGRRP